MLEKPTMTCIFILSIAFLLSFSLTIAQSENGLQTYLVHVNKPDDQVVSSSDDLESYYNSFLPIATAGSEEPSRIIHSYHHVATGFAARLSAEEVKEMEKNDGIVSARVEKILALHTTHTPNFLGLYQNMGFWQESNYGKGVIIGLLDTGINPDHPSFSDDNMPPPPKKWKGKCEFTGNITCNNKLIGARNFVSGSTDPPYEEGGHGTLTSSVAAGNFVDDANVFGNANGRAAGIAPLAHIAMYKVCSNNGCSDVDTLAAVDAAIDDGVDVLSLSIGGYNAPFYDDGMAICAFAAIQKGIFMSASAGNDGPLSATLSNEAPWILTVGASTHDRKIVATAVLGNGQEYDGESVLQPTDFPHDIVFPLVYPGLLDQEAALCSSGSLNNTDVKGKVVVCDKSGGSAARLEKGQTVKDAGGVATILVNREIDGDGTLAYVDVLPTTNVGYNAGEMIKVYINSTSTPSARIIFKGTKFGFNSAPSVISFSSRGPNMASPGIVKPDIIGPGVNVLVASHVSVETGSDLTFNIVSGTSISCPHLSGIAALLKSAHPDWTPAAIKSAIMTTADQSNLEGQPILDQRDLPAGIFATGAGHVNPSKASNPGLIYDIQPHNYIQYLCGLGYTDKEIGLVVQQTVNCSLQSSIPEAELNYPSFSIILGPQIQNYTRTVTNVGDARSTYVVNITQIQGVCIVVEPNTLVFTKVNQQATYSVGFSQTGGITGRSVQGALSWISKKYVVRSPISFTLE